MAKHLSKASYMKAILKTFLYYENLRLQFINDLSLLKYMKLNPNNNKKHIKIVDENLEHTRRRRQFL